MEDQKTTQVHVYQLPGTEEWWLVDVTKRRGNAPTLVEGPYFTHKDAVAARLAWEQRNHDRR